MNAVLDGFASAEDVLVQYDAPFGALDGCELLIALYDYRDWEGDSFVLYRGKDGKLYSVEGSHCSCYGLEGQWEPVETSPDVLAKKEFYGVRAAKLAVERVLEQEKGR